jgi:putative nucleotidyltransferase with HDIG domain
MSTEAPGSWEHARAMANLAEAAAAAIGADALLVRVGAYYHDLGKTIQPKYFVENLSPGERTPHDDLEPDVSADAIMAHVVQGTKILREGGIPEPVVEFAYTHHGTQVIEYFFHKCKESGNPKNLGEDFFRYPVMKPQTKETAILMLVDSIEAASRTIQPPTQVKFEEMIQRVVFTKMKSGQLDESGLTIEDMKILVVKMADTLVNMYHSRIKYPWQEKGSTNPPPPVAPVATPSAPVVASESKSDDKDKDKPITEKPKSSKEKPN